MNTKEPKPKQKDAKKTRGLAPPIPLSFAIFCLSFGSFAFNPVHPVHQPLPQLHYASPFSPAIADDPRTLNVATTTQLILRNCPADR